MSNTDSLTRKLTSMKARADMLEKQAAEAASGLTAALSRLTDGIATKLVPWEMHTIELKRVVSYSSTCYTVTIDDVCVCNHSNASGYRRLNPGPWIAFLVEQANMLEEQEKIHELEQELNAARVDVEAFTPWRAE